MTSRVFEISVDHLSMASEFFNTPSPSLSKQLGSRSSKQKQAKKTSSDKLIINIAHTKYSVISNVSKALGWKLSKKDNLIGDASWDVAWVDAGLGVERIVRGLKPHQRINHFPGMVEIYRKDKLAKSMDRMRHLCPSEYNFTPQTWYLPQDYDAVCSYLKAGRGQRSVIVKPANGAQGRGIYICMNPIELVSYPREPSIVQTYILRPYLIDGYKFDMRIYVLVTSCDPLRIYLFREGLCRFCTVEYTPPDASNLTNAFIHLTNYSINKHNEAFVANNHHLDDPDLDQDVHIEETSSKRSFAWLRQHFESKGIDYDVLFARIGHIVVKTLLSNIMHLRKSFHDCRLSGQNKNPFSCFELLGLDILLTEQLDPVLLEVNHMPSFSTDSLLDLRIKFSLIANTLLLLNLHPEDKQGESLSSSLQSQLRLYGDTPYLPEDMKRRYRQLRKLKGHSTVTTAIFGKNESHYWQSYLMNEVEHMNHFDLLYPADIYTNQVTTGLQPLYDYLLYLTETYLSDRELIHRVQRGPVEDVMSFEEYLMATKQLSPRGIYDSDDADGSEEEEQEEEEVVVVERTRRKQKSHSERTAKSQMTRWKQRNQSSPPSYLIPSHASRCSSMSMDNFEEGRSAHGGSSEEVQQEEEGIEEDEDRRQGARGRGGGDYLGIAATSDALSMFPRQSDPQHAAYSLLQSVDSMDRVESASIGIIPTSTSYSQVPVAASLSSSIAQELLAIPPYLRYSIPQPSLLSSAVPSAVISPSPPKLSVAVTTESFSTANLRSPSRPLQSQQSFSSPRRRHIQESSRMAMGSDDETIASTSAQRAPSIADPLEFVLGSSMSSSLMQQQQSPMMMQSGYSVYDGTSAGEEDNEEADWLGEEEGDDGEEGEGDDLDYLQLPAGMPNPQEMAAISAQYEAYKLLYLDRYRQAKMRLYER